MAEDNCVYGTALDNSGYDPDSVVIDLGVPSGDILSDGMGVNNGFDEAPATSFSPVLASEGWPPFLRTADGNSWLGQRPY